MIFSMMIVQALQRKEATTFHDEAAWCILSSAGEPKLEAK
jgi:hypothetical protein